MADEETTQSSQEMWSFAAGRSQQAQPADHPKIDDAFADLETSPDFKSLKKVKARENDEFDRALSGIAPLVTDKNAQEVEETKRDDLPQGSTVIEEAAAVDQSAPQKSQKKFFYVAAAAVVAIGVAGFLKVSSTPETAAGTVNPSVSSLEISASESSNETAMSVEESTSVSSGSAVVSETLATTSATFPARQTRKITEQPVIQVPEVEKQPVPEPQVFAFRQPIISDSPYLNGKTIQQLAQGSPIYAPIEGLADAAWRGKECSSCHEWNQTSLCAQGQFYAKNGLGAIERKQHPYGGPFKKTLAGWADGNCL